MTLDLNPQNLSRKLRPREAAAYLNLSASTLAKMRVRGDGPAQQVNSLVPAVCPAPNHPEAEQRGRIVGPPLEDLSVEFVGGAEPARGHVRAGCSEQGTRCLWPCGCGTRDGPRPAHAALLVLAAAAAGAWVIAVRPGHPQLPSSNSRSMMPTCPSPSMSAGHDAGGHGPHAPSRTRKSLIPTTPSPSMSHVLPWNS